MSSPKAGWALDDAVRLVEQGYAAEQVERMTGWAAPHVLAQVRQRAKASERVRATAS
ncbi:MAG: hypothetical protein M3Q47_08360 [Actinomycetota bacterium]|nr:hypothetical protein [Actinomycetota bacterium]